MYICYYHVYTYIDPYGFCNAFATAEKPGYTRLVFPSKPEVGPACGVTLPGTDDVDLGRVTGSRFLHRNCGVSTNKQ